MTSLTWTHQQQHPHVDPDGSTDYGSFDEFVYQGESYRVRGDFGEIELTTSRQPRIVMA